MESSNFLKDIALAVIASSFISGIMKYFKQPLIIAYIIAGIILGPGIGIGIINTPENIELISEIGLIFLLFIIGTELNIKDITDNGRLVLIISIFQIGIGLILTYWLLSLFNLSNFSRLELIYLAFSLNISSTLIIVKILKDKFETQTFSGKLTIGVLIFQDLIATLFIIFQNDFKNPQLIKFAESILYTLLILSFSYLLARYLFLKIISINSTSVEFTVLTSISYCFLISSVSSAIGVSKEMGALIAGFSIGNSPYSKEIVIKISSIRDFFVTLFFVSLGLKMPSIKPEILLFSFYLICITLIVRIISTILPFKILKTGLRPLFITSLNLFPVSEFSLVISASALQCSNISQNTATIILVTMLFSSIIAGYIINYSHKIYFKLSEILPVEKIDESLSPINEKKNETDILILGVNAEALEIIKLIKTKKPLYTITVADFNAVNEKKLKEAGAQWIYVDLANYSSIKRLENLNPRFIISTMTNITLKGTDIFNLFLNVKSIFNKSTIIFVAETEKEYSRLTDLGAKVINKSKIISQKFLREITFTENRINRSRNLNQNEK